MNMRFTVVHKCVGCREPLTSREQYYSQGVCPHCGYVTVGTICDTVKVPVKIIRKRRMSIEIIAALFFTAGAVFLLVGTVINLFILFNK